LKKQRQAADAVAHQIADIAARLSGWGAESLEKLVEAVETAKSTDATVDRSKSSVAALAIIGLTNPATTYL
jgi:hypothetical protein